jgi:hypothetical protein
MGRTARLADAADPGAGPRGLAPVGPRCLTYVRRGRALHVCHRTRGHAGPHACGQKRHGEGGPCDYEWDDGEGDNG